MCGKVYNGNKYALKTALLNKDGNIKDRKFPPLQIPYRFWTANESYLLDAKYKILIARTTVLKSVFNYV